MDEVLALSTLLRDRHASRQPVTARLDDIPLLTRSLTQVAADSSRLLAARLAAAAPPTPALAVHPAALRLFASLGFDPDRLRRAVASVPAASSFVDVPVRTPGSHRHLAAIPPRALDDARLKTNTALAEKAHADLVDDLKAANRRLLARLAPLSSATSVKPTPRKLGMSSVDHHHPENDTALALALSLHPKYVDVIRAIALDGQAHSAPFLMHEAAVDVHDTPHFVESLAVLASVARFAMSPQPPHHLMIWGARVVLEDQFAETIPNMPQKPRNASPQAIVQPITDYVTTLHREGKLRGRTHDEHDNGRDVLPLWPRIFFCLRVGNVGAALAILRSADAMRYPLTQKFLPFLEEFVEGKERVRHRFWEVSQTGVESLDDQAKDNRVPMSPGIFCSEHFHESLANLYASDAWPSNDPYLRVCAILLMRLEILPAYDDVMEGTEGRMPSHPAAPKGQLYSLALPDEDLSGLFASVEDYLWSRLWLCRSPLEIDATMGQIDSSSHFVNFKEIQEDMRVCGSGHFDPEGDQPLLYAFVLVCCGLYEDSVSYLTSHPNEQLMHPGVHIAMVLYQLRWMEDDQAFHSVLVRYISNFSRLFPVEAALYLMTSRNRDKLSQSLKELILDTGEYDLLTKDYEDWEPLKALEQLSTGRELPSGLSIIDIENIRVETAHYGALEAAQRGEFAAASELYKLSGELAASAEMSMRNLAEVVDQQHSSKRGPAVSEARRALETSCASNLVALSISALLRVSDFFEEYWKGRYQSAWQALRCVGTVPLSASEIANCRHDLTGAPARFDHCLRQSLLEVLKLALNIAQLALEQNEMQHQETPSQGNRREEIRGNPPLPFRSEVKSLCTFAGCIEISDPTINEKLVHIEMLLSK